MLHDYAGIKNEDNYENHNLLGAEEAEKILKRFNYSKEKIEKIKHCIYAHRGSVSTGRKTLEAKCVASVDAMAHFDRMKNQVVEQLIKDFILKHEWPKTFDAIWAFEEDILELKKSFKEHVVMAHLSQPLGKPLHKYIGQIILEEDALLLSGKNSKTKEPSKTLIPREKILELFLGWDDILRRWKDTRAWIRPLRVRFEDDGKTRTLYIYAKKPEETIYGRENKILYEKLKEARKVKSAEK
jgi:hypothetical protein